VEDLCEKTPLLSHLYIKVIVLPRQARDKHRENSEKKDDAFFAGSNNAASAMCNDPTGCCGAREQLWTMTSNHTLLNELAQQCLTVHAEGMHNVGVNPCSPELAGLQVRLACVRAFFRQASLRSSRACLGKSALFLIMSIESNERKGPFASVGLGLSAIAHHL
jgi:hypothetical protein